ncbi:MAG: hypothetical protein ABS52_11100 [Gemmatimonadetes bacterium SCN 70-22]|nr:MAG: hypothetical protein ABS52_11100 [Gemmatimonadetes bacterium SCN 70-22]
MSQNLDNAPHSQAMLALITGAPMPPLSAPVEGERPRAKGIAPASRGRRSMPTANEALRPQHTATGIEGISSQLHRGKSALAPGRVTQRDVLHFYPESRFKGLVGMMRQTVADRRRLFVHGRQLAVGVSTFLHDYANTFNFEAVMTGRPERLLYVAVPYGTSSPRGFLDTLANAARASLSTSEVSKRATDRLLSQCLVAMRSMGVVGLIIDHVHHLEKKAMPFVAEFLRATDATASHVPLEYDEFNAAPPRMAVILASHIAPTHLFRSLPHVRSAMSGSYLSLDKYKKVEACAEAVRRAGVGLEDLELSISDDRELVVRLLEVTDGLPGPMSEVLSRLDAFAQFNGVRPDLTMLELVLETYTSFLTGRGDDDEHGEDGAPAGATPVTTKNGPAAGSQVLDDAGTPRSSDAAQQLKRMKYDNLQTSQLHKALLRSGA